MNGVEVFLILALIASCNGLSESSSNEQSNAVLIDRLAYPDNNSNVKVCRAINEQMHHNNNVCYCISQDDQIVISCTYSIRSAKIVKTFDGNLRLSCPHSLQLDAPHIVLPTYDFSDVKSFEFKDCSLKSESIFNYLMKKFNMTKVEELKIHLTKTDGESLTGRHFRAFHNLKSLEIISKKKLFISESAFKTLDQTTRVKMHVLDVFALSKALFMPFKSLESLSIVSAKSTDSFTSNDTILQFEFKNCTRMNDFELKGISRSILLPNFLAYRRELVNVTITENKIENISESFFKDSVDIEKIILSRNQLRFLPSKLFRDQHFLIELDLSYNNISKLHSTMLSQNTGLEWLDISHNRLKFISR